MNTNWSKILLFSLLSFALGWLICCFTCRGCHGSSCDRESACGKGGMCAHGGGMCEGSSCKGMMGHGGKDCCKGMMMGEGKGACCKGMGHGSSNADVVIEKIKASDFEGDTTVAIEGGNVKIHKEGDQLKVEVEMKDSTAVEKTVEVHTH